MLHPEDEQQKKYRDTGTIPVGCATIGPGGYEEDEWGEWDEDEDEEGFEQDVEEYAEGQESDESQSDMPDLQAAPVHPLTLGNYDASGNEGNSRRERNNINDNEEYSSGTEEFVRDIAYIMDREQKESGRDFDNREAEAMVKQMQQIRDANRQVQAERRINRG